MIEGDYSNFVKITRAQRRFNYYGSNLLADLHISKLCITVPPKLAIVPYGTSTTGGLICPNFPSLKKE